MMCVFFYVYVQHNYLVEIIEYPWCIIEFKSKHFPIVIKKIKKNKSDGKTGIFTQKQFSTKSIFYMVVIKKLITINT
ncbi:Uncharacterized protein FWK35_00017864 [Aphis craccivora]|uniref:Uncharacterized protein n=1 Tax=Aphis craccivora TaxID=307492 RepID=A0A6G0YLP3_APHCR|nr:Uncharacterized protein FWK35_00017864 [Aphis craccivora]